MSIRRDGFRFDVLRRSAASLLLLAFALRALVPIGYMPDFSATSKGVFKVVICSAMGAKTILLDVDGKPTPDQKNSDHDQPCAFAGLAAVGLPTPDVAPLAVPEFHFSNLIPRLAHQMPPSRAGPQLGSRGPPQVS